MPNNRRAMFIAVCNDAPGAEPGLASLATATLLPGAGLTAQPRPTNPLLRPGVSAELATQRRAQLSDVRYALALTVSDGDTATGRVTVEFTRRGTGDVVLDFRGLALDGPAQVNDRAWDTGAAWNRQHLALPAALLSAGRNRVTLDFHTAIASAGAAIIRYRDATDSTTYLYTLLVPSDANLLFPCFDQPDLKARVQLTLTTPRRWRALANGALRGVDTSSTASAPGAAQITHRFAETQPLSTYLIAFAAGPWNVHTHAEAITEGGAPTPVSLWVRASRATEA
jgi:aminopeptidase N